MLSKGHASLAVYAALYLREWLTIDELSTYCANGTRLGTHPEAGVPGVDFATGSLGHGLSLAAGAALAGRLQRSKRRAFCLLSDAECNEGSVWEAVMFAAHHRLSNLVAIVDLNGQQALGYTKDVLDLSPMAEPLARRSAGTSTRSTATTRSRSADTIRALDTRPARRTCSSRARCSARASPSWSAASSGTTCPMTDGQYRPRRCTEVAA